MRKQLLVLITGAALSLFTVAASAQSASDNNTAAGSTAQSSSSAPSQSSASSDMSSQASANSQQTLEGCIVKDNTDYFIQPMSGERRHLTGSSQDLSSNVGKHVRVQGTDESTAASASATSPSSSTSASSDRTATSGSSSAESQNNAAGSIAGNAGSSNASGTGASASSSMGKDFLVTKVEKVSESCPADIQSKIDQNKSK